MKAAWVIPIDRDCIGGADQIRDTMWLVRLPQVVVLPLQSLPRIVRFWRMTFWTSLMRKDPRRTAAVAVE